MRYIRRDANGTMTGHYANPQAYAQEAVPDNHPEIVAWKARQEDFKRHPGGLLARIAQLEEQVARLTKKD